jgi:hypothetical protein
MQPDEPNGEEKLEELPEDNQTPFQAATPPADPALPVDDPAQGDELDSTHPATDSGMQPEEQYEAGTPEAAGASEPNAGSAVTGMSNDEDEVEE